MPSSPINRSDYTATSPIQPTSSPCINLQVSPYLSRWRLKYAFYTLVLNSRRPKGLTPIPSHPPPRTPSEFLAQWSLITLVQRRLPWAGRYGLTVLWYFTRGTGWAFSSPLTHPLCELPSQQHEGDLDQNCFSHFEMIIGTHFQSYLFLAPTRVRLYFQLFTSFHLLSGRPCAPPL